MEKFGQVCIINNYDNIKDTCSKRNRNKHTDNRNRNRNAHANTNNKTLVTTY